MEDMKGLQQKQERERGVMKQQSQQQLLLQQNPQPQQPQKCPRCESLNTKFCYYNNYSLSQPRYFCKACKRYWTQGGTLRNIPIGGGCRKGKRTTKKSPSSSSENEHNQQHHQVLETSATISTAAAASSQISPLMVATSNPSSLYNYQGGGGGFLSSLAAFQSLNQIPINADTSTTGGGDLNIGVSNNLALLQGFSLPSFQQHHQHSSQIQNMGIIKEEKPVSPPLEGNLIQSNRPSSLISYPEWLPLNFNNSNTINPITSGGVNYWGNHTTTTTNNNNNNITTSAGTTSLNLSSSSSTHQLSDLLGGSFGAAPPSSSSSPPSLL